MRKLKGAFILLLLTVIVLGSMSVAYAGPDDVDKKKEVESLIKSTVTVDDSGKLRYTNGTVKIYVKEKADGTYTEAVTLNE